MEMPENDMPKFRFGKSGRGIVCEDIDRKESYMKKGNILSYLGSYKKECVIAPLFKLLESCFDLTVPLVMAAIINKGIEGNDKAYILRHGGILLLLAVVGLTCSLIAQYFAAKAAVGFATKLRHGLFEKIESLSFKEMDTLGTSTMITRMTSDINQVQSGTNMVLRLFLRSPFIVFGAMVMAFTIDVKAALIFVCVIPLLAIVVFGVMLVTMPMYQKVQGNLDKVLGRVRQNLTGVRVIRAFHKEESEEEIFREENSTLTKMQLCVGRVAALTNPVTYVMINVALVVLLYTGAVRINVGGLAQGDVVALVNYMSQILVELVKLANTIVLTTKAVASGKRLQRVMDMQNSLTIEDKEASAASAKVTFQNVAINYTGEGDPSLEHVNFSVQPGETVGVIGGTGSGKSTLVNLIPRFYDVTEGAVLIDGEDVRSMPFETLRSRIGIVMQKAVLFHGTIAENISWGKDDATEEEIIQALKDACSYDFVMAKEGGIHAMIEQGGRNLSGGQKQRLSIARALVRQPEILILDDSTSALDYATDAELRANIKKLPYHPTVFLVSQRTSSIQYADKIIVLDDGEVVGMGTHEQLMRECAVYQEIHQSQFKDTNVAAKVAQK